jgi:hypothetical protein
MIDTGGEFKSEGLRTFLKELGINVLTSVPLMSMPETLPMEITLITLLLFKFQVYSTSLHHYYHRPVILSTFRLLYQSTIHHMASINALRLPLKKFFCP